MDTKVTSISFLNNDVLSDRLATIHTSLLHRQPEIGNIACMLYDNKTGLLTDYVHSAICTEQPACQPLALCDSALLQQIVKTKRAELIETLADTDKLGSEYRVWSTEQAFKSAFIVPMFSDEEFLGFLFFEALAQDIFNDFLQCDLQLHAQLIAMTIASELAMIQTLMATANMARDFADLRDFETGLHLDRMAYYARMIASTLMSSHGLSEQFVEHIHAYARLHDIGKIGIPDSILMKEHSLTAEERAIIETHVEKGVTILKQILEQYKLFHLPDAKMMLNIVAHHHEYLDGSGYPNHLKADQIPLEARIVTVADIFDALTSRRPYKKLWTVAGAIEELERMQQRNKLDADCVAALKANIAELETIVVELADDLR